MQENYFVTHVSSAVCEDIETGLSFSLETLKRLS